jgi:hypothetical protein
MATTRHCPYSLPATTRRRRRGSGPMCATAVQRAIRRRRRCASLTRLTARASIRNSIWPSFAAFELELQLRDVSMDLFRHAPEVFTAQLGYHQLQMLDLGIQASDQSLHCSRLKCILPASFVVIRHVRSKLSCPRCSCVVQAPAPTRPVDRGLAGPGLLAHVPSPQRPSPACVQAYSNKVDNLIPFFVERPRFRQRSSGDRKNPSRVSAALR